MLSAEYEYWEDVSSFVAVMLGSENNEVKWIKYLYMYSYDLEFNLEFIWIKIAWACKENAIRASWKKHECKLISNWTSKLKSRMITLY